MVDLTCWEEIYLVLILWRSNPDSETTYLDVQLEVWIKGKDQWVITPIYPIYK